MCKYPRLVSWSYYNGRNLFSGKNDKEQVTKVYITDEAGEELVKDGKYACLNIKGLMSNVQDPYFKIERVEGYTSRAQKYRNIYYKMKEDYPELENKASRVNAKIMDYGEYVFIDMSYLNNYVNPLIEGNNKFYNSNFIHKEYFNKELLHEFVNYRPRAMMGGVITKYEKEELPELFSEIKIKFPELYKDFLEESEWLQEKDSELTWVGKKAKLWSLKEGNVRVKDGFDGFIFYWDGEELTNKKELRDGEVIQQRISPSEKMVVEIVDDKVVGENIELVE